MKNIRVLAFIAVLSLGCAASFAAPKLNPPIPSDHPGGNLTVTENTEIPGRTLKPGTYTIRILDHLTDRMIIQVGEGKGKENLFLAVPSSTLAGPASGGAIMVSAGGHGQALRGYAFSDGTVAEFVYPKADAVAIAKRNNTTIPAVDPASEDMPVSHQLSATDMRMITLWMLTPTRVGSTMAISAARFQPSTVLAASTPVNRASAGYPSKEAVPPPTEVASVTPQPKHALQVLPHTASELPMIWLIALMAFWGALTFAYFRKRMA
jgi:hypothetical protein